MNRLLLWVAAGALSLLVSPVAAETLTAGPLTLIVSESRGVELTLAAPELSPKFSQAQPLCLQYLDAAGASAWVQGTYTSVTRGGAALQAQGMLETPAGSRFQFTDAFTADGPRGAVRLARTVTVERAAAKDRGFLTRFSLAGEPALPLESQEIFMPGIWYGTRAHLPPAALNADPHAEYCFVREDRLPLPLAMIRDPRTGATLTLLHAAPDGSTCAADQGRGPVVDERVQTASVGVFGQVQAALGICFPCAEGERTYVRGRPSPNTWAQRFHPVRAGVPHSYQVLLQASVQPRFPGALRNAWRLGYEADFPAAPATADLPAVYAASVQLLTSTFVEQGGAAGVPFRLKLPGGQLLAPGDVSFQMGFVGQQLPLAHLLLRHGLQHSDAEALRCGKAMVDFWSAQSLTPTGLPRVWFNLYPQPHWRPRHTFLRMACDGLDGALAAWDLMQAHGTPQPAWLAFCRRFGDWLVQHQSPAGTWCREYNEDGTPGEESPLSTPCAIPFLARLYRATGETAYRDAARRAGEWSFHHVHEAYAYVGGTPDNPNVLDKEAGYLATTAFLALHNLEQDARWLTAACQAADFTETWAYSWALPLTGPAVSPALPAHAPATAYSIIAAGHSGADLFMAGAAFTYYRLYLATGDAHYAAVARHFLHAPRLAVEVHGSHGYGRPGLCTEALTLTPPRGRGVEMWLPWLTYSMLEPLAQFEDAFGRMELPAADALAALHAKDAAYASTLGLRSVTPPAGKTK